MTKTILITVWLLALLPDLSALPVITQHPQNQTNVVGSDALFSVAATGTQPLNYQWRAYGTTTTSFTNIPLAAISTLLLTNVQLGGGRFSVVVSDSTGSVTSLLARLTLVFPPGILDPPLTQFSWAGQPVTLKSSFTNTTPMRYQWQWDGADLAKATNRNLTLAKAQITNSGDYRVILSNPAGALTSAVARLTVREMPPPTGVSLVNITNLEKSLYSLIRAHEAPACSLAIMKDGRLMACRGYGFSRREEETFVQPDSLFRIASLSKAITAAAVLKLVDQGRVRLDDPVLSQLNLTPPTFPGSVKEPRLARVTLREGLNHTAGWDRDVALNPEGGVGFEPYYWPWRAAKDLGSSQALTSRDELGWITGFPLQAEPGAAFVYSNNGYLVAGLILEQITGKPYEEAVRAFLAAADITRIHFFARASAELRSEEVEPSLSPLYDFRSLEANYVQFPPQITSDITFAYPPEPFGGGAAWATSTLDYARFIAGIDGNPSPPDLISSASVGLTKTPSAQSVTAGDPYGMGWHIDASTGELSHGGALVTGSRSIAVRKPNGVVYVAFVNTYDDSLYDDLKSVLDTGVSSIKTWPARDLFAATLSYQAWQPVHFTSAELSDPAICGDTADPDGDGVPNLLEYAFGTDPRAATTGIQPTGSLVGVDGQAHFALTFRRLILGYEVNYDVEASSDLTSWSTVPRTNLVGEPVLNSDGTQTVTVRDSDPVAASTKRFLRLRVSRQQ